MDELIDGEVKKFVEASRGIDPLVEGQVGVGACCRHTIRPLTKLPGGNHSKGLPRPEAVHRYFDQSQEA
jgi:hypothetical protein